MAEHVSDDTEQPGPSTSRVSPTRLARRPQRPSEGIIRQEKKRAKAQDRVALRRQKALEKQFEKAQRQSTAVFQGPSTRGSPEAPVPASHSHPISDSEGQEFSPDVSLVSAGSPRPSMADNADLFHYPLETEEDPSPVRPLAPQQPMPQPTKRVRPAEDQGPALSLEMQEVIARALQRA